MPNPRLILCGTTAAAIGAGRVFYQLGPYLAGRLGYDAVAQQYEVGWVILIGVCLGIGVLSAIALSSLLVRGLFLGHARGREALWEAVAMAALVATTLGVCFGTVRPANQYFLVGFKAFIEERASLPEIQRWSRELTLRDRLVPRPEWPEFVSDLSPKLVCAESVEGNREVSLTWGGGFMHWGLTCRHNSGMPKGRPGKRVLEIDDLSYVWVDSQ